MSHDDLRNIPSVTDLARAILSKGLSDSDEAAVVLAREVQGATRAALLEDGSRSAMREVDRQLERVEHLLARSRFRPVLNATGILVHTNLGRSPVSAATARAMADAASAAVALEIEPESGQRGGRMAEIASLLRLLTGAEAALVVNNNAAAILLALSALASGRRVAVSRAEAVEIGGGFRIPDVLAQSGAQMVEVGTTNRTYAADYRNAGIGEGDAILKVHSSNFAISGFVASPTLVELRQAALSTRSHLIEDLGSGTLIDTARFGIDHEPTIQESLASGADVVTFSGDKLLGGPQAGIVTGREELVDRIARHPLARAVRADKTALAGVAETLRHYARGEELTAIPLYRMIGADVDGLRRRADAIAERVGGEVQGLSTTNHVGGGALPGQALPGVALRLTTGTTAADVLVKALRLDPMTPLYGRIEDGAVLLELRTVLPEDDDRLIETVKRALVGANRY